MELVLERPKLDGPRLLRYWLLIDGPEILTDVAACMCNIPLLRHFATNLLPTKVPTMTT
jgi:hypothetical protein